MKWTEEYELGICQIDEQHQMLVQTLQDIYDACSRGEGIAYIEKTVFFLEDYVKKHFEDEEYIQEYYNYPRMKEHKKIHANYAREISKLAREIETGHTKTQHISEVVSYLNRMIRYHIQGEDKVLADYIKYQKIRVEEITPIDYDEEQLTGFLTLESFKRVVQNNIKTKSSQVAFAILQIDGFNDVNRIYGYDIGNEVLIYISGLLKYYENEDRVITHTYQNEFMLCIHETYEGEAVGLLETVRRCVYNGFKQKGSIIPLTLSIGIAELDEYTKNQKDLMQHANIALGVAKKRGRNQVVHFCQQMQEDIKQRAEMMHMLQPHNLHKYLKVVYQPIYDVDSLEIKGAEALMRMVDEQGNFIPPNIFIPFAEQNNLITELGYFCVQEVSKCIVKLAQRGINIDYISINVSLYQLIDEKIVEKMIDIVERQGSSFSKIYIELTESTLIEDAHKVEAFIQQLKSKGSKILLDDFGSGFSALAYLSQVELDIIKLDRSLVKDIDTNPKAKTVLREMIKLMTALGLETVVEGIETSEQLEMIQVFKAHKMQGYYMSKPLDQDLFINKLKIK